MSPWVTRVVPSFVLAIVLPVAARRFLQGRLSEPLGEGISFGLMFLALYPANVYFSVRGREDAGARHRFLRYALGAAAGAVLVILLQMLL